MPEGKESKKRVLDIPGIRIEITDEKLLELMDKMTADKDFRDRFEKAPAEGLTEIGMKVTDEDKNKIDSGVKTVLKEEQVIAYGPMPVPGIVVGVQVAVRSRTTIVPRVKVEEAE